MGVLAGTVKDTFETIERMKRGGVIEDYAVVGAIFYVDPFGTDDVDILVNFDPGESLLVTLDPILTYLLTEPRVH